MGGEFGQDLGDVLAQDLLVGTGGEEGVVKVVLREDRLDDSDEDLEGIFGRGGK